MSDFLSNSLHTQPPWVYSFIVSFSENMILFVRDLLPAINVATEGEEILFYAWLSHEIYSLLFHGIC